MKRSFFVIRNGVDFDRFIADRFTQEKIRNELRLSRTHKVIGMIASLSEHKDHETFIRAAASVLQRELDVVFLVIGEETPGSAIKAKLERLAATLNISSNVVFLGHRDDVDQLVQLLDIVVLVTNPKVHAEGTANSLLEAMAAKVPVIASEGEGTKEVIENEVTGLLVRPEAPDELSCAIIRVLKDSQLALTLATNGFRFAQKNFSLETCVAEYEKLYKQALNSRSDTPRSSHV
jgi:glycosyltransferase involved in cell wall biosynthesis